MEIFYVIGTYPTLLQNMVAKVYEANAPSAEVSSITILEKNGSGVPTVGAGHQVNQNITFTGLDLVPHILRLFTASGTQLQEFNVLPTKDIVTLFDPVYFAIGDGGANTPAIGASSYVNTALAGLTNTDIIIHRNGSLQYPGIHFNTSPSGGFTLLQPGDIFSKDEQVYIQRKPQSVSNYVNDSVVGKQWGPTTGNANMYVDVANVSVDYAATHLRKLIRLSGNSGRYYFRAASAIPIGYPFRFSNQVGGTAIINFELAALKTPAGDVTTFNLASGQIAEFVYDGTKFNKTMDCNSIPAGYAISGPYITGQYTLTDSDTLITISGFANQGTTNYTVLLSAEGYNSNWNDHNDLSYDIHNPTKTATSFQIGIKRYGIPGMIIAFRYIIIKAV
jgi:hypothetical protein